MQRSAPVRAALEHFELTHICSDGGDELHRRRARTDDGNALAGQIDAVAWPVECVERRPGEGVHPRVGRSCWYRQQTNGRDEEPAGAHHAIAGRHLPPIRILVVDGIGDRGVEGHVLAKVEPVDDVLEVPVGLRLGRKSLGPVPVGEQLVRERI